MAYILLSMFRGVSATGGPMAGAAGPVIIDDGQCRGCGLCILACPAGCLEFADDYNAHGYHPVRYSGEGCRSDGLCARACPRPGAIVVSADRETRERGGRPLP